MTDIASTPCSILLGSIAVVDEPAGVGVTTFESNGEVLVSFDLRQGGDLGQIIMGLTANQALQLIERLQVHADACRRAVEAGKGGAKFVDARKRP